MMRWASLLSAAWTGSPTQVLVASSFGPPPTQGGSQACRRCDHGSWSSADGRWSKESGVLAAATWSHLSPPLTSLRYDCPSRHSVWELTWARGTLCGFGDTTRDPTLSGVGYPSEIAGGRNRVDDGLQLAVRDRDKPCALVRGSAGSATRLAEGTKKRNRLTSDLHKEGRR